MRAAEILLGLVLVVMVGGTAGTLSRLLLPPPACVQVHFAPTFVMPQFDGLEPPTSAHPDEVMP